MIRYLQKAFFFNVLEENSCIKQAEIWELKVSRVYTYINIYTYMLYIYRQLFIYINIYIYYIYINVYVIYIYIYI